MARGRFHWIPKSKRKALPKPVIIHKYGDVTLKVGRPSIKRFIASSRSLTDASSVFKSMLSRNYAEGQAIGSGKRAVVRILEDDPQALELLLKILHKKPRHYLKDVSPELFYELAILVDKYDCAEVARQQVKVYMNRAHTEACGKEILEIPACALLAGAAAGFGLHSCFKQCTACLAQGTDGQIKNLFEEGDVFLGSRPLMFLDSLAQYARVGTGPDDSIQKKFFSQGLCLTCAKDGSPEMGTCKLHRD